MAIGFCKDASVHITDALKITEAETKVNGIINRGEERLIRIMEKNWAV